MKYSEAMLKGFEMVDGKQLKKGFVAYRTDTNTPVAACAAGAVQLGLTGKRTRTFSDASGFRFDFNRKWGVDPSVLNDEGMPWEHIYGMTRAAGL
jgi:hypothetical protein